MEPIVGENGPELLLLALSILMEILIIGLKSKT